MKNVGLTWAEIDCDAIAHNIDQVKGLLSEKTKLMAVVKADGYGYGANEVARLAIAKGAASLGVASVDEGIELRKAGIEAPILVFDCGVEEQAARFIKHKLMLSVCDFKTAALFSKKAYRAGQKIKAHLKIETGLGQDGIWPDDVVSFVKRVENLSNLDVVGIYTHFATAQERNKENTYHQFGTFRRALGLLEEAGIKIPVRHVANSAATLDLPETHLDMVRVGSLIYGRFPSADVSKAIDIKRPWKLTTTVIAVREFQDNQAIGEGGEFRVKKGSVIATLPIGYADGFSLVQGGMMTKPHRLVGKFVEKYSGKEGVEIKGQLAPIVGRVSLKHTMVDVSHLFDVMVGETATVPADHLMINSRIPRIYYTEGKPYKIITPWVKKLARPKQA